MDCYDVSILGIEEGGDSMANIAQELMKLLLSIEPVPLIESGVVVAHVLEDLLVEVAPQRRYQEDDSSGNTDGFEDSAHAAILISGTFPIS